MEDSTLLTFLGLRLLPSVVIVLTDLLDHACPVQSILVIKVALHCFAHIIHLLQTAKQGVSHSVVHFRASVLHNISYPTFMAKQPTRAAHYSSS